MTFKECLVLWEKYGGQTDPTEGVVLYNSILDSPAGAIVEVGSASGGTTIILIKAAELVNKIVYSVDPYPEELEDTAMLYSKGIVNRMKEAFKANILNAKFSNLIHFNADLVTCINSIPKDVSVAFIDGCHELSNVEKEIDLLYPLLVKDGWLFVHDTNWEMGQLSKTKETGLVNLWNRIDKTMFKEIKREGSMFCGKK